MSPVLIQHVSSVHLPSPALPATLRCRFPLTERGRLGEACQGEVMVVGLVARQWLLHSSGLALSHTRFCINPRIKRTPSW